MKIRNLHLPLIVALTVFTLLTIVQVKTDSPMILLERFFKGGGWIEIVIVTLYSGFLTYKMQDTHQQSKWRVRSWTLFSIVFFSQLFLGLAGYDKFLMTGDLHLPIPMMILAGPIYRLEISFMPILFLSTIILSGPAWCSHLCYFGAIDANLARRKKKGRIKLPASITRIKITILLLVISIAILLRIFQVPLLYTTIIAGLFGLIGLVLILLFSRKSGRMVNCIVWCPVGTLVNYLKFINPFRFRIADSCTSCMSCVPVCRYGALGEKEIKNGKPGITCTLCGDCMKVCKPASFYYKFPGLAPGTSKKLYLGITIVLHAVFLALARM